MNERARALYQVQMTDFATLEANLYLNGYPDNAKALEYFQQMSAKAKEAREKYECQYGPLTATANHSDRWLWTQTPWPWEMEANI